MIPFKEKPLFKNAIKIEDIIQVFKLIFNFLYFWFSLFMVIKTTNEIRKLKIKLIEYTIYGLIKKNIIAVNPKRFNLWYLSLNQYLFIIIKIDKTNARMELIEKFKIHK